MSQFSSLSRLVLGTVQLGLRYGIANTSGMLNEHEAVALVRAAMAGGITMIDTARAYGDSERRIGIALIGLDSEAVAIVTKLEPLAGIGVEDHAAALKAAGASIESSRAALRRDRLDVLLLHRAMHRTAWGGAVWDLLRDEQSRGTIGRLGVSVQSPQELAAALDDDTVAHVQLPFNMLDYRWREAELPSRLRARPDVTVHVRSVLLQGLLAGTVTPWPILGSPQTEILLERLHGLARTLGRESLPDLALAYVRAQTWISAVIVGMETKAQLATNIDLFKKSGLHPTECQRVDLEVPEVDAALLNPAQWKSLPDSADQVRDG